MTIIIRLLKELRSRRVRKEVTTTYDALEELRLSEPKQSRRPGGLGERMAERARQYLGG